MDVAGEEDRIVSTPPFAESVTEGDVKWEKGELGSWIKGGGVKYIVPISTLKQPLQ